MPLQKNSRNIKKLAPQLVKLAVLMLAGMTLYEVSKQIVHPDITIWQSHIITIIFATLCATVAGYFFLRKHLELNETLIAKNTESENLHKELKKTVKELKLALSEVKTLSGLLPICSSCKKIRDDKGNWTQIEKYIQEHSDADFTHSLCSECIKKLYPDYYEKMNSEKKKS
ncbi:MAG: hypothetical protein V1874_11425 [Spirochaetota bacterium]